MGKACLTLRASLPRYLELPSAVRPSLGNTLRADGALSLGFAPLCWLAESETVWVKPGSGGVRSRRERRERVHAAQAMMTPVLGKKEF